MLQYNVQCINNLVLSVLHFSAFIVTEARKGSSFVNHVCGLYLHVHVWWRCMASSASAQLLLFPFNRTRILFFPYACMYAPCMPSRFHNDKPTCRKDIFLFYEVLPVEFLYTYTTRARYTDSCDLPNAVVVTVVHFNPSSCITRRGPFRVDILK